MSHHKTVYFWHSFQCISQSQGGSHVLSMLSLKLIVSLSWFLWRNQTSVSASFSWNTVNFLHNGWLIWAMCLDLCWIQLIIQRRFWVLCRGLTQSQGFAVSAVSVVCTLVRKLGVYGRRQAMTGGPNRPERYSDHIISCLIYYVEGRKMKRQHLMVCVFTSNHNALWDLLSWRWLKNCSAVGRSESIPCLLCVCSFCFPY